MNKNRDTAALKSRSCAKNKNIDLCHSCCFLLFNFYQFHYR
uniref:Uncharacterized protein n=1 Tax=Escherichia coli TaxID=562 RepID=A0A649Z492_ECOLX|nr:hypothetical protein [Escherichia coli]